MRVALGLDYYLEAFASHHDAHTYGVWAGPDWKAALQSIMADSAAEVVWDLTEVDVALGLHRAAASEGYQQNQAVGWAASATDWELLMFCRNAAWRAKARFYRHGIAVPDPFASIAFCDQGD